MRDLQKRYETQGGVLDVLCGMNLDVRRGEMVVIVGASGVGKSTLLHVMGGLDRPSGGDVRWGSTDPFAISDGQRAAQRNRQVGFVFQFHHLLPEFTAMENVALPLWVGGIDRPEAERRATDALQRVGLAERATHRPGELSGGEQQRTAVARAFVGEAPLILADEPSGNLDAVTAHKLHTTLHQLAVEEDRALVVATHNPDLAGIAERVYRLDGGALSLER